jgi:adenosylcobinamide kinase/adenosylcobinamide-phosphate guanylyltransferase
MFVSFWEVRLAMTLPATFRVALILGGARSGKSGLAQRLAESRGAPLLYLATGAPGDEEMAARIARHQRERGPAWETREAPLALPEAIAAAQGRFRAVLVDCLTLWLTNLIMQEAGEQDLEAAFDRLLAAAAQAASPLLLVSNEVGWGIVPDNALARRFRDLAGRLNQRLAAQADLVVLVAAGLPLILKQA